MTKPGFTLDQTTNPERIAKRIARAGICSRRDAEVFIRDGRVTVNGQRIDSPALNVIATDKITVDGRLLPARELASLWRYYKPRGLIVTDRDEQDRETIFDKLPDNLPRLITVGRLDLDSEGLLLMTNDGDLPVILNCRQPAGAGNTGCACKARLTLPNWSHWKMG